MKEPNLHAQTPRSPHNLGLDAARLLAVSLVLVTHWSVSFLPMLKIVPPIWILQSSTFGVELFFVLSGFLIGGLLFEIARREPSARSWLIFMTRRWLRTLPLYYIWLVILLLVLPAPPRPAFHLLQYATMLQNFVWPMPDSHWFNESWSLAIEEWFYLLFSAVLIATVAATRWRHAPWIAIILFIAGPAIARALLPFPDNFEQQIYHVAILRLDAIAYGVALAGLYAAGSRLFRYPWLTLPLGMAMVAFFWIQDSEDPWFNYSAKQFLSLQLIGVSLGLCLFLAGIQRLRISWTPLASFISAGARISYGIYVMHLTIIATVATHVDRYGLGPWWTIGLSAPLIILLPTLSYRFFESPILALRPRQHRRGPHPDQAHATPLAAIAVARAGNAGTGLRP